MAVSRDILSMTWRIQSVVWGLLDAVRCAGFARSTSNKGGRKSQPLVVVKEM